ncbi:hypothetical protein [Rhizobium rhizoryzae]|uniref:hypothetical protein n=1 Tax=Rhizobium rhizoryzae TaxID=451876 RepID=UPI0028AE3131|nr:hypothetical protein [Rhizobium rhizoryzae]
MHDSEQSTLIDMGQSITDDTLRAQVMRLITHLTPHQVVQTELISTAMECLNAQDAKSLKSGDLYKRMHRRTLKQVQAMLLDRQL